jgi:hypothetical protein
MDCVLIVHIKCNEIIHCSIVSLSRQRKRSTKLSVAVDTYRRADAAARSQYGYGTLKLSGSA